MHVSIFLGQRADRPEHDGLTIARSVEFALYADEHGFAAVYVGEQHFNGHEPYADGFMMASALAPQLRNAYVGVSVVPLVIHHPLLVAERINLLDQLSHGRSIVALSGGRPTEGAAWHKAGIDPHVREHVFSSKLDVLREVWAHEPGDPPVSFFTPDEHGSMDGRLMPRSFRAGRPLWAIGTNTRRKVVNAGARGDLIHMGAFDPNALGAMLTDYRAALAESGADEERVATALRWALHSKYVLVAETDELAWRHFADALDGPLRPPAWAAPESVDRADLAALYSADPGEFAPTAGMPESYAAFLQRVALVGSPETVAARLRAYERVGAEHVQTCFAFGSSEDPGIHRRSLELFATEVMPAIGTTPIPAPAPRDLRPEYQSPPWTAGRTTSTPDVEESA